MFRKTWWFRLIMLILSIINISFGITQRNLFAMFMGSFLLGLLIGDA